MPSSFKILLNWRILNTFHMIMTHIDNEIRCKNCICNRHFWISIRHTSNLIVRMIQNDLNEVNEHHELHINTFQMNVNFFYRTTFSDMRFQLLLEFWSFWNVQKRSFHSFKLFIHFFSPNQFSKMQSDSIQQEKKLYKFELVPIDHNTMKINWYQF